MLRIDLLPPGIKTRRLLKFLVVLVVAVLLAEGGVLFAMYTGVRNTRQATEEELARVTQIANEVRSLEGEIGEKRGELQPIADRIEFVEKADASGEQYWDRFHAINEYIYDRAQMTRFSITNPDRVNFDVIVGDTTETARFVLNLMMCPAITDLSISGLPAGMSIAGVPGTAARGFSPMGPEEDDMMMDDPYMDEGMGPGPGATIVAPVDGDIRLSITATLTESVSEPTPGVADAPPGMPGMPGEFDEFDDWDDPEFE